MEKIRLYIDEDLSDRIAVALTSKGFDAISAHEVNMRGKTDKGQREMSVQAQSQKAEDGEWVNIEVIRRNVEKIENRLIAKKVVDLVNNLVYYKRGGER